MLDIGTARSGDSTVVVLAGEIDRDVTAPLRTALTEAAADGVPRLVVDLRRVSFIDSSGLAVFVSVQRKLGVDQSLSLVNVPPRLQRVLHETAMSSMMSVQELAE